MGQLASLVLLDRDGVINDDRGDYVTSVAEWSPIDGSLEAVARLSRAGLAVAVVTNQSAIGRGLLDEATLAAIHDALRRGVERLGGRIDAIVHCPHRPDAGCGCRKPAPGLVYRAASMLGESARGAPFVGDKLSDVAAARRAGCRPILVRTGCGGAIDPADPALEGVAVYRDLAEAAEAILVERIE